MEKYIKDMTVNLQYYLNKNKILKRQYRNLKEQNVDLREQNLGLRDEILELKAQFNPHEDSFRRKLGNCAIKNDQLKAQIAELRSAGRQLIEIARFVDEFHILDFEPLFKEGELL